MHCYLISYDLCNPCRDYNSFHEAIRSYSKYGKLTESFWAIVTDSTATEIRNYLMQFLDRSDRLIVIQSGKYAAWTKVMQTNEWLKENLIL